MARYIEKGLKEKSYILDGGDEMAIEITLIKQGLSFSVFQNTRGQDGGLNLMITNNRQSPFSLPLSWNGMDNHIDLDRGLKRIYVVYKHDFLTKKDIQEFFANKTYLFLVEMNKPSYVVVKNQTNTRLGFEITGISDGSIRNP